MQDTYKKLQILAPAGSIEQLVCAVNNDCDAVYLGLDSFNARMKAPNFTLDNLSEWVDYCHLFGVRVYVAINTSLKNDEFPKALELLYGAYKCNADGVIVSDIALLQIAGSLPKPFEVVASTQINVHDKYGAEYVKKCGASTVVCARECSIGDINDIASTGIGVECFLHGALCVCQSGQCLFSSLVGGNSGNRGLCAQPCRKMYFVENEKSKPGGYLLSAHDICSLNNLNDLINAGATTFKIEGRNRRPEYAGVASRIYRKMLDCGCEAGEQARIHLEEMFNRGMASNGYLYGDNSQIIYPNIQNHSGVTIGEVRKGKVVASREIRKGDGLKVFSGGKEVCGGVALENGLSVNAQFSGNVSDGMVVHRTTSTELCNSTLLKKRKINILVALSLFAGRRAEVTASCGNISVSIESDFVVQRAIKLPVTCDEISKQLRKTSDTYYTITDIDIEMDEIFIAKSQINLLRRSVLNELTKKIVDEYNLRFVNRNSVNLGQLKNTCNEKKCNSAACAVVCYDESQLLDARDMADYLIYKPDVIDIKSMSVALEFGAFIDLPSFSDLNYMSDLIKNIKVKLVCNNVGQVEFARTYGLDYIAGCGLNIFNDNMARQFDDSQTFIYSKELTLKEISSFECKNGLIFVDGSIALMQLCHCPYKVVYDCDCSNCKADCDLIYRDELNNSFKIHRRKVKNCTFELINGKKMSVVSKLTSSGRYLIDYDKDVLKHYIKLNNNEIDFYKELRPYTKGRLYNKIN